MIISCPSCGTQFGVDESRLAPGGTKVRCSKCSHVWRVERAPAEPVAEQPSPAIGDALPADESPAALRVPEKPEFENPEGRIEPVLTARAPADVDGDEGEESKSAGLTKAQRAKLAAARQKKPRGMMFWVKVLAILIVVCGVLWLGYKMMPLANLMKIGEPPVADVGKVEANPVPAETAPK